MTGTHIRVGQIAIDGVAHAPSAADLSRRVQTAIADALRGPAAGIGTPLSLPQLHIALPHGATEREIAAAVANALRDTTARRR
jgi:hypothetical protein